MPTRRLLKSWAMPPISTIDRKSTRLNSSHSQISYAVFCLKKNMDVNKDGTIQWGQFKVFANVGAQRAGAANGSWFNMPTHHKIPNLKLEAVAVLTTSSKLD